MTMETFGTTISATSSYEEELIDTRLWLKGCSISDVNAFEAMGNEDKVVLSVVHQELFSASEISGTMSDDKNLGKGGKARRLVL